MEEIAIEKLQTFVVKNKGYYIHLFVKFTSLGGNFSAS